MVACADTEPMIYLPAAARCLTIHNTENQKLIDQLRSDLAAQISHVNAVVNEMGPLHRSLELKCRVLHMNIRIVSYGI